MLVDGPAVARAPEELSIRRSCGGSPQTPEENKGAGRMGIADRKRALVGGVANEKSLAWGIAQELKAQGAEVALTYQGEVLEKRVRPLAESIGALVVGELDVTNDIQIELTMSE